MPLTRTPFAAYADASPTVASASAGIGRTTGQITGLATLPPMPMTLTIAPRPRSAMRFHDHVRRMDVAHELRVHRRMPRGGIELLRRVALRGTRRVHQHVDGTERLLDRFDRATRGGGVDQVRGKRHRPVLAAAHVHERGVEVLAAARDDRHPCALGGERRRAREPDALAAAGDRDTRSSSPRSMASLRVFAPIISKPPAQDRRYNAPWPMPPPARSRCRVRRNAQVVFGIVLASFVLSFFHRTAPAAIAGELTRAFAINAAALGTLAATYFYVYTLLQIPVGVLADTLGPRRILSVGSLVAAAGSLLFALAPAWELAAVGRTLGRHRRPRSRSSRSSRSRRCGSPPTASPPCRAMTGCSPAIWGR